MTRPGPLVLAVLTAATLVAGPASPAAAQHGRGRAAPRPSPLAPGEYSLAFERILDAVNHGEGRQALAYYERVAAQAEQQGDGRRAGQADMAVALVTFRLGLYQKTIQSGTRAIELLKTTAPASNETLILVATVYANVGPAYRLVGDLVQARKVFEEGLAYVETFYDDLKRASVAESLRAAQLETMRAFPHPFAWAAFGLTGVER